MNKFYVIVPLVLLLVFGGAYTAYRKEAAGKAAVAAAEAAREAEAEQARKTEAERQAKADADKRAADREAEEKRKEEEKAAKWDAAGRQIADETSGYQEQAGKTEAEVKALESRLAELRAEKEKASREAFDAALAIEAARIRKRGAELEIQRLVEMVARQNGVAPVEIAQTP